MFLRDQNMKPVSHSRNVSCDVPRSGRGSHGAQWFLTAAICAAFLALNVPAHAASQGQMGATSTGSVEIQLTKAANVQVSAASVVPAPAVAIAGGSVGEHISVCIAADGVGAFEVGFLEVGRIQTLSPIRPPEQAANCTGALHRFAMPRPVADARIVTLVASPL